MTAPVCWIIAGPNGAGKSTFALEYLPAVADCRSFVNADLIAAGLAPRSLYNLLQVYSKVVSRTHCFDNVGNQPKLIFEQRGDEPNIVDTPQFELLVKGAGT